MAIGALDAEPMVAVRKLTESLGGNGASTLIGGGSSAPDWADFYNVGLSRYLDFMDSYLAAGETNHPSDNLGAVLAAAESVHASGRDFLTALACAYQVHTRLSDVAPVRAKGFDHTVQGGYAVAAGVLRALKLSRSRRPMPSPLRVQRTTHCGSPGRAVSHTGRIWRTRRSRRRALNPLAPAA